MLLLCSWILSKQVFASEISGIAWGLVFSGGARPTVVLMLHRGFIGSRRNEAGAASRRAGATQWAIVGSAKIVTLFSVGSTEPLCGRLSELEGIG